MNVGDVVLVLAAVAGLRTVVREWTGHGWETRTGKEGGRSYQLAVRESVPAELVLIALAVGSVDGDILVWAGLFLFIACLPLAASIAIFNRPRFLIPPPHRSKSWRDFRS